MTVRERTESWESESLSPYAVCSADTRGREKLWMFSGSYSKDFRISG